MLRYRERMSRYSTHQMSRLADDVSKRLPNKGLVLTSHRVGAPVARGASHRTGLVLFTYGSS